MLPSSARVSARCPQLAIGQLFHHSGLAIDKASRKGSTAMPFSFGPCRVPARLLLPAAPARPEAASSACSST